ncbi:MAG: DUF1553 domain-containing protein [Pirellulaceae bacterium]
MVLRTLVFVGGLLLGITLLAGFLFPRPRVANAERWAWRAEWTEADEARLAKIDGEFHTAWDAAELETADEADSHVLARRLSLALIGTIPSLEELRVFDELAPEERIDAWTEYLLRDPRHADYFGERLARSLVGVENGPFLVYRRRRFVHWLSEQIAQNRPYDELVQQLLTDEGLWTDSPAVNFVTVTLDQNNDNQPDPIKLAARTTRAFLGLRIDCLQCHDDNLGTIDLGDEDSQRGGTQADFHQLAAFFGQVRSGLRGVRDLTGEKQEDYMVRYLDSSEDEAVEPTVPYRSDLLPHSSDPRHDLALWVTHPENRPFARAQVNRVWALMCGRPLVEPIDDLPLHGPFPPGLELLTTDFIEHDFDLRHLIRVIARTEAFRKDSRADFGIGEAHEQAWAVFPLTRLRPEQIAGSIIQASALSTINSRATVIERLARFGQQNEFVGRFGDLGEDEFNMIGGTIPQRLLLMNGDLVRDRARPNDLLLNASAQIARFAPDDAAAIRVTYMTVLTREPTADELRVFTERLAGKTGNERMQEIEDLVWVLMNGSEFFWNH